MPQVAALAINGVSDAPPLIFQPTPNQVPISSYPTDGSSDSSLLGTIFTGWKLYNDSKATATATPAAVASAEKPVNYLLIGGIALAAILLLRR
jgi:hypothetical protein